MLIAEGPIIVKKQIDKGIPELWDSLTNKAEMVKWYFPQLPFFKPVVGFETEFEVHNNGKTFTHQWKIIQVNEPDTISYTWTYPEYPGDAIVKFEIITENGKHFVEVTCTIVEDFPQDIEEFKRESCEGGWEYFLGRLKTYVEEGQIQE